MRAIKTQDLVENPNLSAIFLILMNFVPIIGVLLWDWDVAAIVMLYWAENLIIGVLNLVKMFAAGGWRALPIMAFFTFHYGAFCGAHGFFAASLFELPIDGVMDNLSWPFFFVFMELLVNVVTGVFSVVPSTWIWGVAAVGVSHIFSLVLHRFIRGEDADKSAQKIMSEPYGRIVILHIAIIVGGMLVMAMSSPLALLLILVLLKTAIDVVVHRRKHKQAREVPAPN